MFSGTPDDPDVGTISVNVTAADSFGKTASNVFSLTVINVNDPPVIQGSVSGQTTTDAASLNPMSAMTITDQDAGASEVVTLTLTGAGAMPTDANGTLSGVGLIKTGTGTYMMAAGSPAAVTAALEALTFTPAMNEVAPGETVTTGIALAVNDGTVTVTDTATSVVATSINDAPAIAGAQAGQMTTDNATMHPLSGVTIADPDFGATEAVTILLTGTDGSATDANGILSGANLTHTGAGTYSLTIWSLGAVSAELRALTFTPTINQVMPGQTVTTGMTVTAGDGIVTTTDATTTIVAMSVNDAPVISVAGPARVRLRR